MTKRKEEWEKIQRKGMKYKTKPRNYYDLISQEYGIGYCKNGYEFYFDKNDYELIKDYNWGKSGGGYITTRDGESLKTILMHSLILNFISSKEKMIDHKNRKRNDNRRENLRIVTNTQNIMNMSTYQKTLDKSGVKGVTFDKTKNKWQATIRLNRKLIKLGHFEKHDLESAIVCRLMAEKEYFGEYSAQQHLFEKYNI